VQEALAAVEQDTGAPPHSLEVYLDPDRRVRLPYGDCLTISDEWLNKGGEADLKANVLRRFHPSPPLISSSPPILRWVREKPSG
jgi:hypothetical protein